MALNERMLRILKEGFAILSKDEEWYDGVTVGQILDWFEKQGKQSSNKIVEKARTEKQRVLLTETDGSANIEWDCRSLDDVKVLLKCGLEFIRTIEADRQVLPDNRFGGCSFRVPTRYDNGIKQDLQILDDSAKTCKDEQKQPTKYTLEQAARIFLEALSNTPYNNKPVTDAQVITRELLKFLSDARSYNPNAINEQKPAWSEEDEYVYNEILKRVADKKLYEHDLEYIYKWLKSTRPQTTWKPSDEQMENLSRAVNGGSYRTSLLMELYQDLKKLREE